MRATLIIQDKPNGTVSIDYQHGQGNSAALAIGNFLYKTAINLTQMTPEEPAPDFPENVGNSEPGIST